MLPADLLGPRGPQSSLSERGSGQSMPEFGGEGIGERQVQKALADFSPKQVMKTSSEW